MSEETPPSVLSVVAAATVLVCLLTLGALVPRFLEYFKSVYSSKDMLPQYTRLVCEIPVWFHFVAGLIVPGVLVGKEWMVDKGNVLDTVALVVLLVLFVFLLPVALQLPLLSYMPSIGGPTP